MKDKERWMELCKQASTEQDSKKLAALVEEISRLLEEKTSRLQQGNHASSKPNTMAPNEPTRGERARPSEAHESDR